MSDFQNHLIKINKGKIFIYRLFDIAEEINLVSAETALKAESRQHRLSLDRSPRHALIMRNAPLRVHLGQVNLVSSSSVLSIGLQSLTLDVTATIWDYGVSSILLEANLNAGITWQQLILLSAELNQSEIANQIDEIAGQKNLELMRLISKSLSKENVRDIFEDYVIFYIQEIDGIQKATELIQKVDLAALIFAEATEKISIRSREEVLSQYFQYAENDLTVIDWNSAFVLEPTSQRDIADILEFSLSHLLEFRYFDDLLDKRLADLYDEIEKEKKKHSFRVWRGTKFLNITKEANSRYIEFSEFLERVDNSLKVVGDFYLAVIFRASIRRFRITDWHQSVNRKVNILAKVSELLQGELNVNRGHLLELIIIFLILFEIISAIAK